VRPGNRLVTLHAVLFGGGTGLLSASNLYDNSTANRANPNPDRKVTFGETSNDEMMFGTFEFIPEQGVSPAPPNDRMRMQVLLSSLPADSSYLLTSPFGFRQMSSALYLPRTGDGTWYLAVSAGTVRARGSGHVRAGERRLGTPGVHERAVGVGR
jgi:hypothetical protein